MPKMKTHSGAKKRFRKTASGRIKHKRAGKRHLLTPTPGKRGQFLRGTNYLNNTDAKNLRKFLPYA